jgi:NADH-quinone oxidoreductase subunit L
MDVLQFSDFGVMKEVLWVPAAPLLGAIVIAIAGPRLLRSWSHWPAILGVLGALIASIGLFADIRNMLPDEYDTTYQLYQWVAPTAGTWFTVSLRIDPLTAVMLVTVCTVSLFVIIYSRDYMREHGHAERGYERFFAFLCLFVFSMATLVLAGNFLLLYLGWEAVGLCSYLLIGFYYTRPAAAAAAKKAFLVNRIGDFGFGLGILCIYVWISPLVAEHENPLEYAVVFQRVAELATWKCTTIALLLFCGAIGKSAQLPLHVWLPDAMEGPSPVSALIHAATMVTAGVYMVARCGAIFVQSPLAMGVVAVVGAATALFAATIAVAQYDMKRILAYSTISQLGYMFLGVGAAAASSAIFHLFTHAFFKALLFLGAGSVMHAMGGIIDIRDFSGLRRKMPVTYITFLAGGLALAGFPFTSGFFSKDEIIHAAFTLYPVLGLIGLITAVLTAFYTFRMIFLAFHGPERIPDGVHAHESGGWMLVPLVFLAIGALGAGYVGVTHSSAGFAGLIEPHGEFHRVLDGVFEPTYGKIGEHGGEQALAASAHGAEAPAHEAAEAGGHLLMYVSAVLSILGVLAAYVIFVRRPEVAAATVERAPATAQWLRDKYYVDEAYDTAFVRPLRRTGFGCFAFDNYVIDGLIWLVTVVPRAGGFALRAFQNGALQGYGVFMTAGLVLIVLLVLWAG